MKYRRDCPVCGKSGLLRVSKHLADTHRFTGEVRKSWAKKARLTFPDLIKPRNTAEKQTSTQHIAKPHAVMNVQWQHPFTMLVAGPTGCGKTEFVARVIANKSQLIKPVPDNVIWCYGEWQPAYDNINATFVEGLPQELPRNSLVIIDDLMLETDKRVASLFTKQSHHRNISVIHVVQNIFHKGKEHRTVSLNAHYIILFKNPRDVSQCSHLAKQMYPHKPKVFCESYEKATREPHGYLLVDLKQSTPDNLRLRTYIFPDQIPHVFVPK